MDDFVLQLMVGVCGADVDDYELDVEYQRIHRGSGAGRRGERVKRIMVYNAADDYAHGNYILSIAELFVDQMSLITFYDKFSILPRLRTVGYYLFQQAYESEIIPTTSWVTNHDHGKLSYSQLSAFGVMISCIVIPLSFGMRKLLERISPSED